MSFDTVCVVDWSAGKRAARPKADAIWIGVARTEREEAPVFQPDRLSAEAWLADFMAAEIAAKRRVLASFDFPFGYPAGFAAAVTGRADPFALWDWLEARIADAPDGSNNRFEVAEAINALFDGPGPFWGKPDRDRWPGIPYRKDGIAFDRVPEKRACDVVAKAASSCFQLYYPPTVGGQVLTGLPVLARLRRRFADDLAVWPFEPWADAPVVLAEIWPGLIGGAVAQALAAADAGTGEKPIRDREQVRLLARALIRLPAAELAGMMDASAPEGRREEAWILGAGHRERLEALAVDAASEEPDLMPPRLRNDCFALPQGVAWTPVDDALAALREAMVPVVATERIATAEAAGRVLAADAVAARSNPPGANAAVDGYGFAAETAGGAGRHVLPLAAGRAAAGAPYPGRVPRGAALRILTGALVPEGVDTVVLEEDCATGEGHVAFDGPVKPGANTRKAGEDVAAGAVALRAGRNLTPADVALATALGLPMLDVFARLRVGVLSTGDELAAPGPVPADPAVTYDANRPMLLALARRWGHAAVDLGPLGDDRAALAATLDHAADGAADAILTSGGASAGDEDHVSALLRDQGALRTWRVAVKPGRPLALGVWKGLPVFGLPGNPVAAFVCALVFARPALAALAGAGWPEPRGFAVPAAFAKRKKPGRREYLRARIDAAGRAEVFASEGSGRISGLSWAEGLVELPDGAAEIAPGDPVTYYPFGSYGL